MGYHGRLPIPSGDGSLLSFLLAQNGKGAPLNVFMVNECGTPPCWLLSSLAGCNLLPVNTCFYNNTYVNGKPAYGLSSQIPVKDGDTVRLDYATAMQTGGCGSACAPPAEQEVSV